ncbi:MAG TPA: hypothetical protein VIN09_10845 [Chloroflexota bacterium]
MVEPQQAKRRAVPEETPARPSVRPYSKVWRRYFFTAVYYDEIALVELTERALARMPSANDREVLTCLLETARRRVAILRDALQAPEESAEEPS